MRFLKKFKRKETLESLIKECEQKYTIFLFNFYNTQFPSYIIFKQMVQQELLTLKALILTTENSETAFLLSQHLRNQLNFLNKHSYHMKYEHRAPFIRSNYPSDIVIQKIISSQQLPLYN